MSQRRHESASEERLIPVIRAALARRMAKEGLSGKQIAGAISVTPSAVTQYLKKVRGSTAESSPGIDALIEPLAEKAIKRVRAGLGPIDIVEFLETAHQMKILKTGTILLERAQSEPERDASLELLRDRLQLELSAAKDYLDLANKAPDDYTKLLLRMIASDSMRHGDIVSQVISWLEADDKRTIELPHNELLQSMLALEDSAKEVSLRESIKVDHPVVRLLLESIDMDEGKHGKIVAKMLALNKVKERKDSTEKSRSN
jgi:uncharacterized protein